MYFKTMLTAMSLLLATQAGLKAQQSAEDASFIGKMQPEADSRLLTPENLWRMGRIGTFTAAPDGTAAVYGVTYYSKEHNWSHSVLYRYDFGSGESTLLTTSARSEAAPAYIDGGRRVAFLSSESGRSQIWAMNPDGTERCQLTFEEDDVLDFLFAPDGRQVILVKEVPNHSSIQKNDSDLAEASGMVIDDLMYKHWDTYVRTAPHPFLATFDGERIRVACDLLEGEPYECPMLPFGGVEQLCWSPQSDKVAYTCRKLTGLDYAVSTDSDIYLYDVQSGRTTNLCKPAGYVRPAVDPTRSLSGQSVNHQSADCNAGYDQNPQFSPDGRYIAWSSMERDGYESDRARLCVYEFSSGRKQYVTEAFDSGVNEFCWSRDGKNLYFTGVWHGVTPIYRTDLKGKVVQLTRDVADYSLIGLAPDGKSLLAKRHSMSRADEVFLVSAKGEATQLTHENAAFYEQLSWGEVKERWVETVDGQQELCWVIYPPHFDSARKYPTLLFCEGGPQSPVSQFWSFRWNFQVMAAQGYIIIAPNRRGLPGFGTKWLEEISGDYSGLCMQDYLSAIDDICREPYVDRERLGAVGASFGGYSVYWLAGNHEKRFKAFIAHDGIYNTQQQYVETEELWFPNWDMGAAPWHRQADGSRQKVFETSPHLYVDKWDTPILCIHGQRDFRIEYTQAESAFTAARLRGVPAQLLLYPDENHWVLKPQNGILWQRTFFRWLDRWLKQ
ncbi:MAG: alpha/beta fold hydrolase [Alloprevotella sp.]